MDFLKINLRCILLQIQGKIAEQTAAETTVEIVFEHMVQHIKYIFRGRKNRIGLTVKFHERRLQMIRGEDLIYQLVGTGKLAAIEVKSGNTKSQGGMATFLRKYPEATRIVVGGSAAGAVTVEDFLLGNVELPWS